MGAAPGRVSRWWMRSNVECRFEGHSLAMFWIWKVVSAGRIWGNSVGLMSVPMYVWIVGSGSDFRSSLIQWPGFELVS